MQAQLQAARLQIADALRREVGTWQPLSAAEQGACTLAPGSDAHLSCDNETLMLSIAPREAMLAGLLRAWRSTYPDTRGLSIAVVDGRYQANWN